MPASDIVLRGEFRRNKYTISYYVDGELWNTQDYSYDAVIDYLSNPVTEGREFSGWSYSGGELPSKMPASNLTISGTTTKNTYTVSYYVDEELIGTQSYEYGDTISYRDDPTKVGATFSGWIYANGDLPKTMPARNMDIRGSFDKGTYTITVIFKFDKEVEGAVLPDSMVAKEFYGEDYSIIVPTVSGYAPDQPTVSGKVTGDKTITVTYKPQSYKLIANCVFLDTDKESEAIELDEFDYMESYSIDPSDFPVFPGFLPSSETISGTITGEKTVTINYQIQSYSLLANCVFPASSNKAAETVELGVYKYGEAYEVEPSDFPVFEYYVPSTTTVRGTILGEKTITISYSQVSKNVTLNTNASMVKTSVELTGSVISLSNTTSKEVDVPAAKYYSFVGWFTEAEGGQQLTDRNGVPLNKSVSGYLSNGRWALVDDTIFYAHWENSDEYKDYTYISSAEGLSIISNDIEGKYLLVENIDFKQNDAVEFSMIDEFRGILDGGGNSISNYTVPYIEGDSVGFFGTNRGTIKNITFTNCEFTSVRNPDRSQSEVILYAGIVCGRNYGIIKNIQIHNCCIGYCNVGVYEEVSGNTNTYGIYCGLICGLLGNGAVVQESGVVESKAYAEAWTGDRGIAGSYVGGIAGQNKSGLVENCYSYDNSLGAHTVGRRYWWYNNKSLWSYTGGLIGGNYMGTVQFCLYSGNTCTATRGANGGGGAENRDSVCGNNSGTITDCYEGQLPLPAAFSASIWDTNADLPVVDFVGMLQ